MLSVESMLSKNFKTIGPETIGRPPPPSHPRPPVFESVEKMLYLIIYFQHSPYFAYCELQALNLIAGKFWAMPVNFYLYLLTVLDGSNTSSIKQIFLLKLQVMFNLPEQ